MDSLSPLPHTRVLIRTPSLHASCLSKTQRRPSKCEIQKSIINSSALPRRRHVQNPPSSFLISRNMIQFVSRNMIQFPSYYFSNDWIYLMGYDFWTQVADMHFGNGKLTPCRDVLESEFSGCSDLNTTRFFERMIQLENPDFVAFTGDNIFGPTANDAAESLLQAFGPVMKLGIPWAAVLGNHDQESTMTREELMSFLSLMDFSLSQTFPSVEASSHPDKQVPVPKIDGFGNYDLRIRGAPGSNFANSTVFNLYFLDSGDRVVVNGVRTYDWIKESQLNWLRNVSQKLQEPKLHSDESLKPAVPSLAFFHIPIPEIRQGPIYNLVGRYREYAACSLVNSGVLKTLVSVGDVKAVFIGHDHTNDFCGTLGGLWFCYGGGFGYHGYGVPGWPRRGRVIMAELEKGEKSWVGVKRIRTWKRVDDETLSKMDEQVLWER